MADLPTNVSKDQLRQYRNEYDGRAGVPNLKIDGSRKKKSRSQVVRKNNQRKKRQRSMFSEGRSRMSQRFSTSDTETSSLFVKRGVNVSRKSGMEQQILQLSGTDYDEILDEFNMEEGADATIDILYQLMESWAKSDFDAFSQFRAKFDIMKLQSTVLQWYITHPDDRGRIDQIMAECSEKHGEDKTLPPRIMQQYMKVRRSCDNYTNLQTMMEGSQEGCDPSHQEIERFLIYFRKYTKPVALLNSIIRDYGKTKNDIERFWLLEVLFHWIYIYNDEDFRTSEILGQTRKFVENFSGGHYLSDSISDEEEKKVLNIMYLLDLGNNRDQFGAPSWRTLQADTNYDTQTRPLLGEFDIKDIANVLHDLILEAFQMIRCRELIDKNWDKNKQTAPNVTTLTEIFNHVNHWVKNSLLIAADLDNRHKLLEKFIKIMKGWIWPKGDALPNYHGAMAINTALRSDPIYKLKDAWKRLKPSTASTFEKINNLFKNDTGQPYYKRLRFQMDRAPGVLFMGVTQSDLTFLYDSIKGKKKRPDQNSNDTGMEEEQTIFLKTHHKIFDVIYRVRTAQMHILRESIGDDLELNPALMSSIMHEPRTPKREAKTIAEIIAKKEQVGTNMRPHETRKYELASRLKYEMGEAMKMGEIEFHKKMLEVRQSDREEAVPGIIAKIMECFPAELYLATFSAITVAEIVLNMYVLSIWMRNRDGFWVSFTVVAMGVRILCQLGVVYATDYTIHMDEEKKANVSGQHKNTFYGKAFTILCVLVGLGVPRAAIRLKKENTAEELEVDEMVTTKTSSSKLEFARLHTAQMFESLPLLFLQGYFLNWKADISWTNKVIVAISVVLSLMNVSLRFGQIVRAQLDSFFRYQKKESELVLVVWIMVFTDFLIRPFGPLLCAVDATINQNNNMLLASAYVSLIMFFSLYYSWLDQYQYLAVRQTYDELGEDGLENLEIEQDLESGTDDDKNKKKKKKKNKIGCSGYLQIIVRIFFMGFTMTPHFVYTDTEYLPQYWVIEHSIRIFTSLITVLFLTSWFVTWVFSITLCSLIHCLALWWFIKELTAYNEMKKGSD